MWGVLLALGAALVIHPGLGTGVKSSTGPTETDFVTALLVGGSSMSIVGASDYGPTSPGYKLLFLFDSLVGLSVTSLTITYLMQVYTAVRSRNTLGLMMHTQGGETGDAAELIARWGPGGRFDGGYNKLSTLAGEMAAIKETHHFYPVLFYFRFEDAFYAPSRLLLIALDTAALIRTGLDPRELGWLQQSAALAELDAPPPCCCAPSPRAFPRTTHRPRTASHRVTGGTCAMRTRWSGCEGRAFRRDRTRRPARANTPNCAPNGRRVSRPSRLRSGSRWKKWTRPATADKRAVVAAEDPQLL